MTKQRKEYLYQLAKEYDVSYETVLELATLLGEEEDYDGLVTFIEDMC